MQHNSCCRILSPCYQVSNVNSYHCQIPVKLPYLARPALNEISVFAFFNQLAETEIEMWFDINLLSPALDMNLMRRSYSGNWGSEPTCGKNRNVIANL